MKVTELKIGDWATFSGYKVRIKGLKSETVEIDGFGYGVSGWTDYSELVPIPLDKKILEKNGWKSDDGEYVEEKHDFLLSPFRDAFVFEVIVSGAKDTSIIMIKIVKHVHELQHLLWALGIDDDLKI